MPMIVNPCEVCVTYKTRLDEAKRMFLEGNSDAVSGLLTVTDNMLREPLNPETAGLLKKYPGACTTETFCIYKPHHRKYVSMLRDSADKIYSHPANRFIEKEQRDQMVRAKVAEINSIFFRFI